MSVSSIGIARVSTYQRATASLSAINKTQSGLLDLQNQLTTGSKLNAVSDDPGAAQIAISLQRTLEKNQGYSTNLSAANNRLSLADSALGSATDLLQQVNSLASANVGSDSSADARSSAASVVQSIYSQLLSIANTQSQGLYLFGGDAGSTAPYVEANGGVKYAGSSTNLTNAVDDNTSFALSLDGGSIFGGTSSPLAGANLQPALTSTTRLSDLNGALGAGVAKGKFVISDGTTSQTVDLSDADTVGDVLSRINATGLATATLSGSGITLTGGASANLTVTPVGTSTTAADLGIVRTTALGNTVVGSSAAPKVTGLTPISALRNGAGLNLASGLRVTNGTAVYNLSFTGATTVQDLLNVVNSSGSGAQARINADGTGVDFLNPSQGTSITIAENGGTLASQLGVRSFSPTTPLSSLNNGLGVQTGAGADFQITAKDGTSYPVDLNGASTIQDVIGLINTATGGSVTASFATTGNGIVLTDSTGGSGALTVGSLNGTTAAAGLGLAGTTTGTTLQGTDVNPIRSNGVFDNLLQLADALQRNDTAGITKAASGLTSSLSQITTARGVNGAKVKELDSRTEALQDHTTVTKSMLSDVKDLDYTEAITRYQTLQTMLQASYAVTSQTSQMSLLDYLK